MGQPCWKTVFVLVTLFAAEVAADSGDDFSNNLFSDLAPAIRLLALFGERVTMQFISGAMGWADNIALSMAPLGIITTIVSAIRVGGPTWLKAIIGRARENLAVAEAELMSSTSDEVCELWNGREIVRCIGSTAIREFIICIPDATDPASNPKVVAMSLEDAMTQGYIDSDDLEFVTDGSRTSSSASFKTSLESAEKGFKSLQDIAVVRNPDSISPNISLNCHNRVGRGELRATATLGTILQAAVLVYSGFATYYGTMKVKLKKDDNFIESYAYPCMAIGTLLLVSGMVLCAHVVESSTDEERYNISEGCLGRLVWLQQQKTVSDQVFKSSALYAKDDRHVITTSTRAQHEGHQAILNLKTLLGTGVGLCGFVVQFVGLRGLHWSVSVAQLIAVLIMTALRAWVSRGLSAAPGSNTLSSSFELEWLALTLNDLDNAPWLRTSSHEDSESDKKPTWTVPIAQSSNEHKPLKRVGQNYFSSQAHTVMKIRRDLGRLANWPGVASPEAIAMARSIEIVMDTLFGNRREGTFTWFLGCRYMHGKPQPVKFRLEKSNQSWMAHADEIEAALSLWLYSVDEQEQQEQDEHLIDTPGPETDAWLRAKASRAKLGLRLLGPYTRCLHRDLGWWMPSRMTEFRRVWKEFQRAPSHDRPKAHAFVTRQGYWRGMRKLQAHRVVGCASASHTTRQQADGEETSFYQTSKLGTLNIARKGLDYPYDGDVVDPDIELLATETHVPLKQLYAQDMFTSFMWTVAKSLLDPVEGEANIKLAPPTPHARLRSWTSLTLENEKLSKMAEEIHRTGLGSVDDVFLSMLVPLSVEHKLPSVNKVVDMAREQAKPFVEARDWNACYIVYMWLFRTANTFPPLSEISITATAMLMDLLRTITAAIEAEPFLDASDNICLCKSIESRLETADKVQPGILWQLMSIYERQGRGWKCDIIQEPKRRADRRGLHDSYINSGLDDWPRPSKETTKIFEALSVKESNNLLKDIHGWTYLHYEAVTNHQGVSLTSWYVNCKDLGGSIPLHYACEHGNADVARKMLREGADIDCQAGDGGTPLHRAVAHGQLATSEFLMQAGAALDVRDSWGRIPLHWASYRGHDAVVEQLGRQSNLEARDRGGATAVHLAAIGGMDHTVKLLIKLGARYQVKDREGLAPLHWAASIGHTATVEVLLQQERLDLDATDLAGFTALHKAAENGRVEIVKLLIDSGADVEASGDGQDTALHRAVAKGQMESVKVLLSLRADKGARGTQGKSMLHVAAENGRLEMAQLFVDINADLEATDHEGNTPLHLASSSGKMDLVKFLLDKNANIEAENKSRDTPLRLAAMSEEDDVVRLLFEEVYNEAGSSG
ncbi:hypothetical protein ACHAPT_005371 [Fusarium lateritium]